ncbi:MAG: hypothetical protein IJ736_09660, partial [Firmicutes bacterium]|nr:hypothetical protein [Bacillota bacterium]
MPKGLVNADSLAGIAAAIRVLNGSEELLKPAEMANAIMQAIPTETASGDIASITSAAPINAEDVAADINLQQDLHGYDSPWPACGGKNLVGLNTSPAGNITYTYVTALEQTDDKVVLTSTEIADYAFMNLFYNLKAGTYTASIKTLTDDPEYNPSIAIYKQPGNVLILRNLTQNNPATFTLTEDALINFRFFVMSNDSKRTVTFYDFQLESGSAATSWVPYANVCPITGHTGMELTNTGKNCMKFTAVSQTVNGVAMTVNTETGELCLNGTAAANTIFEIGTIDLLKPGVNYILTGCPSGGGASTYCLAVPEPDWTYDYGEGIGFKHSERSTAKNVRLIVQQGVTVDDLVFKPMIRCADTDSTFEKAANSVYNEVFGEIVYSGRFDLPNGELTSDMAYEQMTYSYLSGLSSDYIGYVYTEANGNEIWVRNWNYNKAVPRKAGGIKAASNMFQVSSMHDTDRTASQNRIYFKVGEIDNVADF